MVDALTFFVTKKAVWDVVPRTVVDPLDCCSQRVRATIDAESIHHWFSSGAVAAHTVLLSHLSLTGGFRDVVDRIISTCFFISLYAGVYYGFGPIYLGVENSNGLCGRACNFDQLENKCDDSLSV